MVKEKINELVAKYGSPLYVFQKEEFVKNYLHFEKCFKNLYPKYQLAYSYKTNYTPVICEIVKQLGGYAEVVSDMEYNVAKRLGYDNEKIIYNGPYKTELSIEHLLAGGILNIDNIEEVKKVCVVAEAHTEKQLKVGIRVNINIGQCFISRFGIDSDNSDLDLAFYLLKESGVKVEGLHCHIGQSRTIQAWKNRAEVMLTLADKYFPAEPPKYLNLGSGMFAVMKPSLAEQFGDNIPSFEQYAAAVAIPFAEHYASLPEEKKPILFTEPGTTIVNSYIDFVGRVDSIKRIKGQDIVVMDCSKHMIGDICQIKQLPIDVICCSEEQIELNNANFVGYTCLEHDVRYTAYHGKLGGGDYVVFANVGGYSNNFKPPFIAPNCAMCELDENGNSRVIKRREEFDDVFITYIF